jgi:hypothetical protein
LQRENREFKEGKGKNTENKGIKVEIMKKKPTNHCINGIKTFTACDSLLYFL